MFTSHAPGRVRFGERDSRSHVVSVCGATEILKMVRHHQPEFYTVAGTFGSVLVSRVTAHELMSQLARVRQPRFVQFVDLSGSLTCVRTSSIYAVWESTAEQRAADRALRRRVDDEETECEP